MKVTILYQNTSRWWPATSLSGQYPVCRKPGFPICFCIWSMISANLWLTHVGTKWQKQNLSYYKILSLNSFIKFCWSVQCHLLCCFLYWRAHHCYFGDARILTCGDQGRGRGREEWNGTVFDPFSPTFHPWNSLTLSGWACQFFMLWKNIEFTMFNALVLRRKFPIVSLRELPKVNI